MHDVILRHVTQEWAQPVVLPVEIDAVVTDAAAIGGAQAGQSIDQRTLARTGGTQDHHELPALDVQADVVQDRRGARGFAHVAGIDLHAGAAERADERAPVEPEEERPHLQVVADDEIMFLEAAAVDQAAGAAALIRHRKTRRRLLNHRVQAGNARVGENHVHVAADASEPDARAEQNDLRLVFVDEGTRPEQLGEAAGPVLAVRWRGRPRWRQWADPVMDHDGPEVDAVARLERHGGTAGEWDAVDFGAPAAAEIFQGAKIGAVPFEATVAAGDFSVPELQIRVGGTPGNGAAAV